jgi:hypothetical protein
MPGEFEPHQRTVHLLAGAARDLPGPLFAEAEEAHAELARRSLGSSR